MQRFMGKLDTAIKAFVEEKLTPITENMEDTTPEEFFDAPRSERARRFLSTFEYKKKE